VCASIALVAWSGNARPPETSLQSTTAPVSRDEVFPMAVWYRGGTARAPMLERDAHAKKDRWRKDLQQIRALGF
jgi:beta-galactosidase